MGFMRLVRLELVSLGGFGAVEVLKGEFGYAFDVPLFIDEIPLFWF